jgi:hypothetical protein
MMIVTAPVALMSLGVLVLIASNMVWNTSMIAVGRLACLMAFVSVFFDPSLYALL